MGIFAAPVKLEAGHDLRPFDSGEPVLDEWLRRRAWQNEQSGASRTYIVCAGSQVIGYYSLATGAIARALAPGGVRRNMPEAIPAMVLGRLGVDRTFQGAGLGRGMLRDAIVRTQQAAEIGGIRVLLVHALSERAKGFYEGNGFRSSPIEPMTLMITMAEAAAALGG